MRYRIIEESNAAGDVYYTAALYKRQWYGLRHWETVRSYRMDFTINSTFDTRDAAMEAIKKRSWKTKIVEEGTL